MDSLTIYAASLAANTLPSSNIAPEAFAARTVPRARLQTSDLSSKPAELAHRRRHVRPCTSGRVDDP
jgi:hypothetical protein